MSNRYRHVLTKYAYSGHFEPLAKHIENGGSLTPCMREVLVAILKDEVKFKRGNRRTFSQEQLDREIGDDVGFYQEALGVSRSKAMERYLDDRPDMNRDTLKSVLKRYDDDRKRARERIKRVLQRREVPPSNSR